MNKKSKRIADVYVRWMIRRDMPEVLEIENRSSSDPWTEEKFLHLLRQANCIGVVAEHKGKFGSIYGFMIYGLHKNKLALLNFAVAPEVRRTGVGLAMVQRLKDKLSQQRRRLIEVDIREDNLPAQLFFSNCGFKARRPVARQINFQYVLTGSYPGWQGVNRITEYDATKAE